MGESEAKGALAVWNALVGKIRQLIRDQTKSAVRKKKMNIAAISTANQTVTVYEASDPSNTITVPYRAGQGIEWLSTGQSVIVEWIYDDLSTAVAATPGQGWSTERTYYLPGDTLTHGSLVPYAGLITTSTTMAMFSVPLPKSMENITSVTVDSLIGSIRGVSGYVDGTTDSTDLLSMGYTVSVTKSDDRTLRIILTKSSAFTNATNNTPVTVYARVGLSFS